MFINNVHPQWRSELKPPSPLRMPLESTNIINY